MELNIRKVDAHAQHAIEIAETLVCWRRKPLLRAAYKDFHRAIRSRLAPGPGLVVELGSGIGSIKETIPECITTDLFENPLVDQMEDAYALSFAEDSVSTLILFDVWHHLEYPGSAMDEFFRVLQTGGRLVLFEPAALSCLGRLVYGLLHHEPIHAPEPAKWRLPEGVEIERLPYYAAQGNAWKLFAKGRLPSGLRQKWQLLEVSFLPAFDWLASGGFRQRQLCPSCLRRPLVALSGMVQVAPALFATRMFVVLEKAGRRPPQRIVRPVQGK